MSAKLSFLCVSVGFNIIVFVYLVYMFFSFFEQDEQSLFCSSSKIILDKPVKGRDRGQNCSLLIVTNNE